MGPPVECAEVLQTVTLTLTEGEDPVETQEKFHAAIEKAICKGELQDILDESYPDTDLFVATCSGKGKKSSKKSKKSSKKSSKKGAKKSKKGASSKKGGTV